MLGYLSRMVLIFFLVFRHYCNIFQRKSFEYYFQKSELSFLKFYFSIFFFFLLFSILLFYFDFLFIVFDIFCYFLNIMISYIYLCYFDFKLIFTCETLLFIPQRIFYRPHNYVNAHYHQL